MNANNATMNGNDNKWYREETIKKLREVIMLLMSIVVIIGLIGFAPGPAQVWSFVILSVSTAIMIAYRFDK